MEKGGFEGMSALFAPEKKTRKAKAEKVEGLDALFASDTPEPKVRGRGGR